VPDQPTSPPLHNRRRELAELERAWRSGKPELLLAVDRRRAGKSHPRRFLQGRAGFYYQATKTTACEQLRALGEAAAVESPQSGPGYGSGSCRFDTLQHATRVICD
jgi:hypothetical protein